MFAGDVYLSGGHQMADIIDGLFFISIGPAFAGHNAFVIRSEDNPRPNFRYGFGGLGTIAGAYGRSGVGRGPQLRGPFFGFGGVVGESHDDPGTAGTSVSNIGVYGQTEEMDKRPLDFIAGVYGTGNTRPGVVGWSNQGIGVEGVSGKQGPAVPNLPVAGVLGSSADQPGIIGTSNTAAGVHAFSNNVGIVAETTNDASFAGIFRGNVVVHGTLTANVKNSVVTFPDRTQRVLHCMESPEHWFEDFGAAKLKAGRAVVKLDADFVKVVTLNEYHVFVTPEGDCRGLCVSNKSATSFEVRELQGGTSNVAFSYRIVARRKDIKAHQRFAKIDTRQVLPAPATRPPRDPAPTRTRRRGPAPPIKVQDASAVRREAEERKRKGARTGRG
jgi:hypothetical protein